MFQSVASGPCTLPFGRVCDLPLFPRYRITNLENMYSYDPQQCIIDAQPSCLDEPGKGGLPSSTHPGRDRRFSSDLPTSCRNGGDKEKEQSYDMAICRNPPH